MVAVEDVTARPLLQVQHLATTFAGRQGAVHAVRDVSFSVRRGETVGVVGESGSGKSVTALSILGLIDPPGEVTAAGLWFDGVDLTKSSEETRRRLRGRHMAMIMQDPVMSLNPVLTIGRQIVEPIRVHLGLSRKAATERAVEALDSVGMPSPRARLQDYPHQFSGGMCQRLMIAMALACGPELLIADEPTSALDVTIQAQILELIMRLKQDTGMAVLLITHDMGVVAGRADRVIVMYAGRIVEQAETLDLFASPAMPYTIGLLDSIPSGTSASERLRPIPGSPPQLLAEPKECPFAPRCSLVQDRCREAEPPLREVRPEHFSACILDPARELLK